jgi:glycosyltransferase involved in cell wall biosynthesis
MPASPVALLTGSYPPHDVCGVGDYTRCLFEELEKVYPVQLMHRPIGGILDTGIFRAFEGHALVHVEYPTEGWGNSLLPSLLPMARRGKKLLLTLHEWSQMNRVRRASILPLLLAADGFVFVSQHEMREFERHAPALSLRRPRWHIPIGVNLESPRFPRPEVVSEREALLEEGRYDLLLTHFGFIHAGKQPEKLLSTLLELESRGKSPRLVFVGGFQRDKADEAARFDAKIRELGLDDRVLRLGFVQDPSEAARKLAAGDVGLTLFSDGLSARRGSFWYAVQHGGFVISTEPASESQAAELEGLFGPPQVRLVAPDVAPSELAELVDSLPKYEPYRFPPVPVPSWSDIAARHAEVYRKMLEVPA